ncbi:hypothetical protein BP5796_00086 [Coleophoma crateriformis]|uniref:Uncharacterized protein n=1 Tax=Coleophoma crateriformis TaxID=565419 RepID=A0A3D8T6Z2_9HELO|nr:hypothetical protein BP5796_00086 [Coleophoma crateriformis]
MDLASSTKPSTAAHIRPKEHGVLMPVPQAYFRAGQGEREAVQHPGGTILDFGSEDVTYRFEPEDAFFEQVLEIDNAIRELKESRKGLKETENPFWDFRSNPPQAFAPGEAKWLPSTQVPMYATPSYYQKQQQVPVSWKEQAGTPNNSTTQQGNRFAAHHRGNNRKIYHRGFHKGKRTLQGRSHANRRDEELGHDTPSGHQALTSSSSSTSFASSVIEDHPEYFFDQDFLDPPKMPFDAILERDTNTRQMQAPQSPRPLRQFGTNFAESRPQPELPCPLQDEYRPDYGPYDNFIQPASSLHSTNPSASTGTQPAQQTFPFDQEPHDHFFQQPSCSQISHLPSGNEVRPAQQTLNYSQVSYGRISQKFALPNTNGHHIHTTRLAADSSQGPYGQLLRQTYVPPDEGGQKNSAFPPLATSHSTSGAHTTFSNHDGYHDHSGSYHH